MIPPLWLFVLPAAALFCGIETYREFQRKKYVLAAVGAACTLLLLLTPVQTHAVKFDLPPDQAGH
jgi:hypothetical protein